MRTSIGNLSVFHKHNAIGEAVSQFVIVRNHQDRQRILVHHLAQKPE